MSFHSTARASFFPSVNGYTKNIQFNDLFLIPHKARLTPIGLYMNISFINCDVNQPGVAGVTLIAFMPHAKPNQALGVVLLQKPQRNDRRILRLQYQVLPS